MPRPKPTPPPEGRPVDASRNRTSARHTQRDGPSKVKGRLGQRPLHHRPMSTPVWCDSTVRVDQKNAPAVNYRDGTRPGTTWGAFSNAAICFLVAQQCLSCRVDGKYFAHDRPQNTSLDQLREFDKLLPIAFNNKESIFYLR